MKSKLAAEVSDQALAELFDPTTSADLNVPLAEHVLRVLAYEYMARGAKMTPMIREVIIGPETGTNPDMALYEEAKEPTEVLFAFVLAFREGKGQAFPAGRIYTALRDLGFAPTPEKEEYEGETCQCGHIYDRHFNPDNPNMLGLRVEGGCKYCSCANFIVGASPNEPETP